MLNFSSLIKKSVSILRTCFNYLTKCFSNSTQTSAATSDDDDDDDYDGEDNYKNLTKNKQEKNFNLIKNNKNDINFDENRIKLLNESNIKNNNNNNSLLLFKTNKKTNHKLSTNKKSKKKLEKNLKTKMTDCSCESFRSKLSGSIECLADTLKTKTRFMRSKKPKREEYEGPLSKMTRRLSLKSRDIQERFMNNREEDKEKRKSLSSLADSLNEMKRDSQKSNQISKNIYTNSMNNSNSQNSASKNTDSSIYNNSIEKFNNLKPLDISKFKIRESYLDEIESEYVRPKPKI
jgi:hypothetical protein